MHTSMLVIATAGNLNSQAETIIRLDRNAGEDEARDSCLNRLFPAVIWMHATLVVAFLANCFWLSGLN